MSDIFDSRDLLDELKTLKKEKELNKKLNINVMDYEEERIEAIKELIEEVGKDNFEMGVTFIRSNYWVSYCEDCAYDFGFISSPYGKSDTNPLWYHIDWESWADSMAQDYDQIEFDGDDYIGGRDDRQRARAKSK